MRQQTQSVSLRLIPPVALSFALTATIDAFISRPPLVLQRLSPRTQLSHQPSKSSFFATSCPSSSFLVPHCCRSAAVVLPPFGRKFVSGRQFVMVLPIQSSDCSCVCITPQIVAQNQSSTKRTLKYSQKVFRLTGIFFFYRRIDVEVYHKSVYSNTFFAFTLCQ